MIGQMLVSSDTGEVVGALIGTDLDAQDQWIEDGEIQRQEFLWLVEQDSLLLVMPDYDQVEVASPLPKGES